MNSYLLTYSQACAQAHMHNILNSTVAVDTWVAPFPYAAILVSRLGVRDLSNALRIRLPNVWFMVTEVNGQNVDGWLPGDLWLYTTNPVEAMQRASVAFASVG